MVVYLAALGVFLAFGIDATLPAFGQIGRSFGVSGSSITLLGTVYFLGMAGGQLVWGPASDAYGRQRALYWGLAAYGIGALGSALAPSFPLLLAARVVWGLGAASPAVLRGAIARDLFDGDVLSRVVTTVMAVFLIGPIFTPAIGQLVLSVASWRVLLAIGFGLAVVAVTWTARFGETLPPEARRPLDVRGLLAASRTVATTRATALMCGALALSNGAFFVFLGSSQPIIDRQYGRGPQFPWWFAVSGVFSIAALVINNRLIKTRGTVVMTRVTAALFVVVSAVGLALTMAADGRPSFGSWFAVVVVANALNTVATPMMTALALQPMGAIAGTASAWMGFLMTAGGALLAALVDAQISHTVTPMLLGYVVYGALALVLVFGATAGRTTVATHGS